MKSQLFPTALNQDLPHRSSLRLRLAGRVINLFLRDAELTIFCRSPYTHITVGRAGTEYFAMEIDNPDTLWDIIRNPDPVLGEAFMDGKWVLRRGDLGRFMTVLARNAQRLIDSRFGGIFSRFLQTVPPDTVHDARSSRKNASFHYDLGNDLYELFLDEGMNYSCAFWPSRDIDLRQAQLNKIHAIIGRLGVAPGMRVLEIGCGWGETASIMAREAGAASVTGITLADRQLAVAKTRANTPGLGNRLHFELQDYREHAKTHLGAYDRIYSIGMFEHVGADSYGNYFAAIRSQLAPGGKALVHSIISGREKGRNGKMSSQWLERYIFPGGEICDLQTMLNAAKAEGLTPVAEPYVEPSYYYAETLRHWRSNFTRNMDRLDPQKYDERFRRMWLFYLAMCEAMFEGCGFTIAQVVFKPFGPAKIARFDH
ncbi:MAG: SAM-dependent methyltransferase [Micavibrio sp.]|nr:SAM-dependent methyltransferase [Micavibrio sp.]